MDQSINEPPTVQLSPQLISIMTTEHYNLQTGRSMTIAEANGRASLFVGAVSSSLIALTFVGQISQLGTAFYVFSLIVIPTLLFMGLTTFVRVLQSGLADMIYARGINRIRHLYLEYAPQMEPYFILSANDDGPDTMRYHGKGAPRLQSLFTMAGMMSIINGVLVGAFVGLLLGVFVLPLWACASLGVVSFILSVSIHQRFQRQQWTRLNQSLPVRFPSQPQQ